MKTLKLSALVAAGLLAGGMATSASAADLGGNCCADLEERIAELEATTVRKGNRKVSLTLSGWVAEQIMWWDDGHESNTYVTGIGTTLASNFKLSGQATIAPGWSAGYLIHVEVNTNDTFVNNQFSDESIRDDCPSIACPLSDVGFGTRTLQSYWWVKSEQLGKVSVGRLSQASDNTAILVDGSGSLVPANWVLFEGSGFFLRSGGAYTGFTWGDLMRCQTTGLGIGADCNGVPENVVRYDSPTFAGFSISASWGEDDMWDVAARYAGEFGGFKLAVAAAYTESDDENTVGPVLARDMDYFQVGAYVQHVASGLFVYGAYGSEDGSVDTGGGSIGIDTDHWYVKAGIRCRMSALGHTVFYGEYGEYNDQGTVAGLDNAEVEIYGGGIVQEIDAAAMSVWLHYRHLEGDATDSLGALGAAGDNVSFEDLDIVKFGALINF